MEVAGLGLAGGAGSQRQRERGRVGEREVLGVQLEPLVAGGALYLKEEAWGWEVGGRILGGRGNHELYFGKMSERHPSGNVR